MYLQRDRLLMGLFTLQLVGAMVFGLIVANSLAEVNRNGVTIIDGSGQAVAGQDGGTAPGSTSGSTGNTTSGSTSGAAVGSEGSATTGSSGTTSGTTSGGDGTAAGSEGSATGAGTTGGTASGPQTGGEGTRTGITDDTIKIGVLVTQTGVINFRSSAQATRAFFDALNEAGGIHGRRVEMILRDDALDKNKGAAAVEEMIQAGVFAFVAFNAPNSEQDVLPVLDKHKIPLIGAFAIPSTPYGYIFSAPYETYGRVGGDRLAREGATNPGLVYLSNQVEETDRIIVESWRLGLQEHGLELPDENVFAVDVTKGSYDDVVTQMRFNGIDAIGSILEGTGMKRLQQSLNRAAYAPLHVSSPFGGDPEVLADPNVGSSFEGIFVLSDVDFLQSGSKEGQRYESEVNRRFGGDAELNWAGQHGWIGAKVFTDAMMAIGPDPTRERLLDMVNSFDPYETGMTPTLHITADPATHNTNNQCMKVGKVANAKVTQIADWVCPPLTLARGGVG